MIKLYYNKTTTQFISYDDGGMPIIQGDDGQKEFHIYFDEPSVIGAYNCRVVIERPDGAKSNEIYATPITGVLGGYYKVVVSSWVAEVEGVLKITTRLKTINNEPIVFGVANIPVQFGVDPDENETITDTQYEAIQNTVDGIINGQTPLSFDQLNLYSGSCSLDFDNKFDCESNGGVWTYADALTIRYNGKDPVLSYRGIEGELFKNLFEEAEPASGVTFTNGMPIMYAGSVGASGKVFAKPTNLNELRDNPQLFLGIVTEVTTEGHAVFNWYGTVSNINTIGKTLGETLYVGNGVLLTHANKPISPLPLIPIGIVERVHAFGKISVRPDIGRSLGQLHNVYVNGNEVDGITIVYNDETGRYEAYDLKGNIFRIDTEIGNIKNGTTIVEKAKRDKNGNDIVETYETKADTTSKLALKANITYVDSKDAVLQSQINGNVSDIESLELGKEDKSMKGQPNGYAPLDVSGYIPSAFVPNSFDDVIEFNTYAALLAYGMPQTNKLFIVKQDETSGGNHSTYRWTGTMYIRVTDEMSAAEVKVLYESNADTNAYTDLDKNKLAGLLDGTEYYNKEYIDALKDKNGWKSELLGTLSNNGTIALSVINQFDEIQMYAKDTLGVIDNENVRPSLMQSGDSVYFFDDTQAFIMVDTVFGFYAPVGYTLQVVGLKYTDFTAEEVSFDDTVLALGATNVQEAITKVVTERMPSQIKDIGLDTPIEKLNNHTLREVFEDCNLVVNGDFSDGTTGWATSGGFGTYFLIDNNEMKLIAIGDLSTRQAQQKIIATTGNILYITFKSKVTTLTDGVLNTQISDYNDTIALSNNLISTVQTKYITKTLQVTSTNGGIQINLRGQSTPNLVGYWGDIKVIDKNLLGISDLTISEMNYWFNVYQSIKEKSTTAYLLDALNQRPLIAQETWIVPTLTGATSTYLKYRKDNFGTVVVEGNINIATAGINFTLPIGYRPLFAYTVGKLTFNTNGTVVSSATGNDSISVRFTGGA